MNCMHMVAKHMYIRVRPVGERAVTEVCSFTDLSESRFDCLMQLSCILVPLLVVLTL